MANDNHAADALGVLFVGILGLFALGSLASLSGPSPSTRTNDTPPADPKARIDWYLRQLQGTRDQESASRTRTLLKQLSQ
jgi:hypothetical protein